jgi:hypothetical protein
VTALNLSRFVILIAVRVVLTVTRVFKALAARTWEALGDRGVRSGAKC